MLTRENRSDFSPALNDTRGTEVPRNQNRKLQTESPELVAFNFLLLQTVPALPFRVPRGRRDARWRSADARAPAWDGRTG